MVYNNARHTTTDYKDIKKTSIAKFSAESCIFVTILAFLEEVAYLCHCYEVQARIHLPAFR